MDVGFPKRRYFGLPEVASKLGCPIADLVHFAATDQVTAAVLLDTGFDTFVEHHKWVDGEYVEGSRKVVSYSGLATVPGGYLLDAEIRRSFSSNMFGLPNGVWLLHAPWANGLAEGSPGAKVQFDISEIFIVEEEMNRLLQLRLTPSAVSDGGKRASTLMKLISSLCLTAGVDPSRRGAARDLEAITDRAGLHVGEDTILKVLKELPAAKREPNPK